MPKGFKIVEDMPTDQGFVALWYWNGELYSNSFKYVNGGLVFFDEVSGGWSDALRTFEHIEFQGFLIEGTCDA